MGNPTTLRLVVSAYVGDMEPEVIEFNTIVTDPDEGIQWINTQLRELADAAA